MLILVCDLLFRLKKQKMSLCTWKSLAQNAAHLPVLGRFSILLPQKTFNIISIIIQLYDRSFIIKITTALHSPNYSCHYKYKSLTLITTILYQVYCKLYPIFSQPKHRSPSPSRFLKPLFLLALFVKHCRRVRELGVQTASWYVTSCLHGTNWEEHIDVC